MLVLGGARSGKSTFAEELARSAGAPLLYVATAVAGDDAEMAARIRRHQQRRSAAVWSLLEEPLVPADRALANLGEMRAILLEDATLLLTNYFLQPRGGLDGGEPMEQAASRAEQAALEQLHRLLASLIPTVIVSNEVGCGIVPETTLGRGFRDSQGRVNQALAAGCDAVYLLVAGIPMRIKP